MRVELELPEDIARSLLAGGQELARTTIEGIALEGYRSGRLSQEQVRRLLGYGSRFEVDAFLKSHEVYLSYSEEDLDKDIRTAREFSDRWLSSQTPHP